VISSATVLSIVSSTILSLSAIYSGVGIAKADSVIATIPVGGFPEYDWPICPIHNRASTSKASDIPITIMHHPTVLLALLSST
jgi:hypothetical protein